MNEEDWNGLVVPSSDMATVSVPDLTSDSDEWAALVRTKREEGAPGAVGFLGGLWDWLDYL